MKKKTKRFYGVIILSAFSMLLAGCGGSASTEALSYDAAAETAMEYAYEGSGYATDDIYLEKAEVAVEEMAEEAVAETPEIKDTTRKLIKTVDMSVETETFDILLQKITEKTENLGGYIESNNIYNGSHYYEEENRNANLTLRIPAEKLESFMAAVSENSNVISRNDRVEDVTLHYVDMKSHKEALETEQTRLLELLEQAESIEDVIAIESRLSEVRYQIESMESQLRTLDNQVTYSTVYLYIEEVAKYTPVKEQSTWEKIATGFTESLYDVGKGIKNFVIGFIIMIPHLVVWAVVVTVIVFIIKLIKKSKKKKKQKQQKQEERQMTEDKNE